MALFRQFFASSVRMEKNGLCVVLRTLLVICLVGNNGQGGINIFHFGTAATQNQHSQRSHPTMCKWRLKMPISSFHHRHLSVVLEIGPQKSPPILMALPNPDQTLKQA
jgi:hypothetical protein